MGWYDNLIKIRVSLLMSKLVTELSCAPISFSVKSERTQEKINGATRGENIHKALTQGKTVVCLPKSFKKLDFIHSVLSINWYGLLQSRGSNSDLPNYPLSSLYESMSKLQVIFCCLRLAAEYNLGHFSQCGTWAIRKNNKPRRLVTALPTVSLCNAWPRSKHFVGLLTQRYFSSNKRSGANTRETIFILNTWLRKETTIGYKTKAATQQL